MFAEDHLCAGTSMAARWHILNENSETDPGRLSQIVKFLHLSWRSSVAAIFSSQRARIIELREGGGPSWQRRPCAQLERN